LIKINLLRTAEQAQVMSDDSTIRRQGLSKLLLLILPVAAMYAYESYRIPELNSERNRTSATLEELRSYNTKREESVREIKKFKEDESRIQQRIAALEKLQKDRTNEVKVLKLMADVMPEKAWLTQVDIRNGKARISGLALTNNDVSTLAERLKSNILVAELQLNDIREDKVEGTPLMRFDFTCLLEARK
jgi:type IV pilus assembly protein PilN